MLNIKSLIDYEDSEGNTLLFHAVKKNDLNMIKELIGSGANINHISRSESILTLAYRNQHYDLINTYFYSILDKFEPKIVQSLMSVVNENHLDMIDKFKLNINRRNAMPLLHKAVQEGNVELIKNLIEKGVDVNLENAQGEKALFYLPPKLRTQTILDILTLFKQAKFDFNYQNKNGKTAANHIIYYYYDKKKIAQYIEAYKLPINYLAKSEYQDCLLNEHVYAKLKIREDASFFKEVLFKQITRNNIQNIDIKEFKLEGNNSLMSLLDFMKENHYSINTEFSVHSAYHKATILEVIASKYLDIFGSGRYTFSKTEQNDKEQLKIVFNLLREKILSFEELNLNQMTTNTFAQKTHTRPIYFNKAVLFFLKDYILENNCNCIDLTLKDSSSSSVIKHCINDETLDLITPFLQTQRIDYNSLNQDGSNLILEIVNTMSRSNRGFNKIDSNKIFWMVIENTPMTDLKLKNNQGNTLEKELASLGLLENFEDGKIELEKKWLEKNTQSNQPGRKIKL